MILRISTITVEIVNAIVFSYSMRKLNNRVPKHTGIEPFPDA